MLQYLQLQSQEFLQQILSYCRNKLVKPLKKTEEKSHHSCVVRENKCEDMSLNQGLSSRPVYVVSALYTT